MAQTLCRETLLGKEVTTRKSNDIDERRAEIELAFREHSDVTSGRMMSSWGLKRNGKIFAMFPGGRFVVKLPKERVDALVTKGDGRRYDPGRGRVMKEWIVITNAKLDWVTLATESYRYLGKSGT